MVLPVTLTISMLGCGEISTLMSLQRSQSAILYMWRRISSLEERGISRVTMFNVRRRSGYVEEATKVVDGTHPA